MLGRSQGFCLMRLGKVLVVPRQASLGSSEARLGSGKTWLVSGEASLGSIREQQGRRIPEVIKGQCCA